MSKSAHFENSTPTEANPFGAAAYAMPTSPSLLSGLEIPRSFLRALGLLNFACAAANHNLARLDAERTQAIQRAALEVARGIHDAEFGLDIFQVGDGATIGNKVSDVIAQHAQADCNLPVNAHLHVNHGQHAGNLIPASLQMALLLDIHEQLLPALQALAEAIGILAEHASHLATLPDTSMSAVYPFSHWATQIRLATEQIHLASQALTELPMGDHAQADPEFAQHLPAYINNQTSLKFCIQSHPQAGIPLQDKAVVISGQLRILALSLIHICQGIQKLQQDKKPEPESAAMACIQVVGNDAAINFAAQIDHSGTQKLFGAIAYNLLQSINLLSRSAQLLTERSLSNLDEEEWKNLFNPRHPHNASTHKE